MSDRPPKTIVTVTIAGDEYTIRTDATAEYTRECAEHVDKIIAEIKSQGTIVEAHKIAILAALSLTDQLFRTRAEGEAMRKEVAAFADRLVADIERRIAPEDLASHP